jgi:hypothetical protein
MSSKWFSGTNEAIQRGKTRVADAPAGLTLLSEATMIQNLVMSSRSF